MAGTIATLVHNGVQFLNPNWYYLACAIVCAIPALSIGSAWTVAGTLGVGLIGIANALGVSPEITAGAVISGAYFGDKMSPLSETTNLAPAVAGTDLYTHIKGMMWTAVPSILITLVIFGVIGYSGEFIAPLDLTVVLQAIESVYNVGLLILIPLLVVLILSFRRVTAFVTIMKAAWVVYGFLTMGLIVWYKIYTPIKNWRKPWQIIENRVERGDARTLVVKPIGHDGWTFEAGQFAWIKTGRTPLRLGHHPISLSSMGDVPPGGSVASTIKNLGDWSGKEVPALKLGERVWLDGPHGVFTMDCHQAMGFVLIGGGVGITPLYSMLQTMAEREDVRPALLFMVPATLRT
jgi:hypothetical protein